MDDDGKADLNIDLDGDDIPDIDIDSNGDGKADTNIDQDGDGAADENIIEITEWKAETKIGKMCTMLLNPDDNDPKQPNEDEKKPNSDVQGEYYPGANMGGALTGDTTNIMIYIGICCMAVGVVLYLSYKHITEKSS